MNRRTICWILYIGGCAIVFGSYIRVVSAGVGWIGWVVGMIGWALWPRAPKAPPQQAPPANFDYSKPPPSSDDQP
ncbi:MAG: hypothetical protein JST12_04745 [Armatimonadetes bacterium]|nr:hypothetical protein [Armatimonadota bacterium]MBS1700947.1 hypothetical protein [Armatimonadota bacterium]MBS1727194.1 hypothetical protein [Armatimonadota bacterium]